MLRVMGLTKTFITDEGEVEAAHEVTFEVKTGEVFALLGPSGCGKSTTLRCIAGLELPDAGEIWIDNDTVFSSTTGLIVPVNQREIGMVFQSYAVWPHMNVARNVGYPLTHGRRRVPRGELNQKIKEVLRLVQLEKMEKRPASLLSGGQQQRVAVARALVAEPKLLLLDEPLSNLDAKLRVEMRQELRELFTRVKLTALYVTHDQEEALVLSDRIAVMDNGRIMQVGSPIEIYKEPANTFVAEFVGTINVFDGRVYRKGQASESDRVDSAIGELTCPVPQDMGEGHQVSVTVRPEAITIHTGDCASLTNCFSGTVKSVVFTGNRIEYDIQVRDVLVRVERSPYLQEIRRDQKVWLELPPDRIRLMST